MRFQVDCEFGDMGFVRALALGALPERRSPGRRRRRSSQAGKALQKRSMLVRFTVGRHRNGSAFDWEWRGGGCQKPAAWAGRIWRTLRK
jgi:hypothetical protein